VATRLAASDVAKLDPYKFMAVIGKRVIHPGGRASTDLLLQRAEVNGSDRVLDIGCGVATRAVEIARRSSARVTAADISPVMLERAEANVRAAGVANRVSVGHANILELPYEDSSFDVVIAEAVTMIAATVLDVRQDAEYAAGHVPGALHVELGALPRTHVCDGPLTVMCGHGERATTAASLLVSLGHRDITVLAGGPGEWAAATDQDLVTGR
jgi:rhodanese-related sulfurtransferase